MANKLLTIEDYLKKYSALSKSMEGIDSYGAYKAKNGDQYEAKYTKALESLYRNSKKNADFGAEYAKIANQGLHNSGYMKYLGDKIGIDNKTAADKLSSERDLMESKLQMGYLGYLEKQREKTESLKSNVTSTLIQNGIVNKDELRDYAIKSGLSSSDAEQIAEKVYSVTKNTVFRELLEQVTKLGLDAKGAAMLAEQMGVSKNDADRFGKDVEDMLGHYSSISDSYLDYLESIAD